MQLGISFITAQYCKYVKKLRAAYWATSKYILSNSGKPKLITAIPSQVLEDNSGKGVETERQASHVDEETVRTANSKEVTKVSVVRITDWSQVRVLPSPPDNLVNDFCI